MDGLRGDRSASYPQYVLARSLRAFANHGGPLLCPLLTSSRHRVTFECTALAFGQALLPGTPTGAPQIRTQSVPAQAPDLPTPCLPVRFRGHMPTHPESSASYQVSVRSLAGLGENAVSDELAVTFVRFSYRRNGIVADSSQLYERIRRLPSHGLLPRRSCLRLVLSFVRLSFGILTPRKKPELSTGDFHPTRSRPCWAYM